MPVEPYLLIMYVFALASATRLVTIDDLTEHPRDWVVGVLSRVSVRATAWRKESLEWLDDRPWTLGRAVAWWIALGATLLMFACWFIGKMITCPWCASFWLGLGLLALVWNHGHNPVLIFVSLAFALRMAASMLVEIGR